jgi:predicted amidohydrolase
MMQVGILQFAPRLGRVDDNREVIGAMMRNRKFDLAVLPELATTGYNFANRRDLWEAAEDRKGKSYAFFAELAADSGGAIVWGTAEKAGRRLYNSAVLTTPEGDHHVYRKTRLFFREKLLFDPGNAGFNVFAWRKVKVGMMICFDWIFPEAARTLALKGCQVLAHPANLVMPYCQDAMVTRSLENRIFCVTANRVGQETTRGKTMRFTGQSQLTTPTGARLLRFTRSEKAFKAIKINPRLADTKMVNRLNDLFMDRRTGYYGV